MLYAFPPPQKQLPAPRGRSWFRHHLMAFSLVALCVFLFLVATNTQSGWVFVIVACTLAILVINYFLTRSSVRLNVERNYSGNVSAGSSVSVTVTLINASSRPKFGVTVSDYLPATLPDIAPVRRFFVNYIPAHGQSSFTYDVPCQMRGCHHFSKITLESCFPLGIFWMSRTLEVPAYLIVTPSRLELTTERLGQDSSPEADHSRLHRGLSDDFYGLREYVVGDDLRHVSWSASARAGELMMKEYQDMSIQSRLFIAIDPTRMLKLLTPAQEDLEAALSLAASLVQWCVSSQRVPQLVTVAYGEVKVCQPNEIDTFLAGIQSETDPVGLVSLFNWIHDERNVPAGSQVVYLRVTGSEQNAPQASDFGQRDIFTVICGPDPTPPTLSVAVSNYHGKTLRLYPALGDKLVSEDVRQAARDWNPMITCNHYGANQAYQCGKQNLEQTFEWIVERLQMAQS